MNKPKIIIIDYIDLLSTNPPKNKKVLEDMNKKLKSLSKKHKDKIPYKFKRGE